jgi:cytochrome bd-type quinol oxidase subunit 2
MIEMSAAVAAIFCAVLALSLRSAAKRCIEAGIEGVPTGVFNPLRRPVGVLASTCAALVIGAFVALAAEAGGADRRDSIIAALGSAALVVSVLFMAWQVRHASGTYRPAREWLGRAAVPMAVAVGVAAALSAAPAWTRFLWGEPMALALILTVGAAAILTTVALVERAATRPPDEQRGHACRAVVRSALPVLAACIAVLSLAAGMWLNRVDARYARAAEKTSLMRSEIDMTAFARYQKEVQEAVRQWTPPPPHP